MLTIIKVNCSNRTRQLYHEFNKQKNIRKASNEDSFSMTLFEHINGPASTIVCNCDKKNCINFTPEINLLLILLTKANIFLGNSDKKRPGGRKSTSSGCSESIVYTGEGDNTQSSWEF